MKKLWLLPLLILVLGSCETLDKLTTFDIDYTSSVTIPSSIGISSGFSVPTPDIKTNSESKFENNNTNKDLIEEVYLKDMVLSIKSPSGEDFSFLKSLTIYIEAEGLEEQAIASAEDISNDATTVQMTTSKVDIQQYVKADSFKLRVESTTDETITQDYELEVYSVFTVNAKILGI